MRKNTFLSKVNTLFILIAYILLSTVNSFANDPYTLSKETNEIIFIDSSLKEYEKLAENIIQEQELSSSVAIVFLESDYKFLEMRGYLSNYKQLNAIHILSHGEDGKLFLGEEELSAENIIPNRSAIFPIKDALVEGGDILLYGCEVAKTSKGEKLIEILSQMTGADVAASSNKTGASNKQGDWKLEKTVGEITTPILTATEYKKTLNLTVVHKSNASAMDLARNMLGDGVTINSASYTGYSSQVATFTANGGPISFDSSLLSFSKGVIFSSGKVTNIAGPNDSSNMTGNMGGSGDPEFTSLAGMPTHDASFVNISFTPSVPQGKSVGDKGRMTMQVLFLSEEYNEYVYAGFNDTLAIIVNGENQAIVPNGLAFGIDTINDAAQYNPSSGSVSKDPNPEHTSNSFESANPSLFRSNTGVNTQADGYTRIIPVTFDINFGQVNTLKVGIADTGDFALDSWLLVKSDSAQTLTIAEDDTLTAPKNVETVLDVLANDSDLNGNPLHITKVLDQPISVGQIVTLTSGIKVRLNINGTLSIIGEEATTNNDTFTYEISNGKGGTAVAFVTLKLYSTVAEYHFDECVWDGTNTEVKDSGGNGLHGVAVNGAETNDGKINRSGSFDGSSYVKVNNSSLLEVGKDDSDFTVSFWMKLKEGFTGSWRNFIHKGNSGQERTFAMWMRPNDNKIHYRISTTSNWNDGGNSVQALNVDEWTHITYVKEGNKLKLYLNGIKDSEDTLSGDVVSNSGPLSIGKGTASEIDEFKIIDQSLTPSQIKAIYDNESLGKNSNGTEREAVSCLEGCDGSLPITQVVLQTEGQTVVQTASGQGGHNDGEISIPVSIASVTIDVDGEEVVLDAFATEGFEVKNINIPSSARTSYFASINGEETDGNSANFKSKIEEVLGTTDIRDYIRFETNNTPSSMDIMYKDYSIDKEDYVLILERAGNSKFHLEPLDANGNVIAGSKTIYFEEGTMTWDTGYKAGPGATHYHQNQYIGVIKASCFNVGENKIYGFRLHNNNGADPKFFVLGEEEFYTGPKLIAEYRLDECQWTGTANEVEDQSKNNLHGTASSDAYNIKTGKVGRAGLFNGEGSHISVPHTHELSPDYITVSAWVNPEGLTKWDSVVSKSSNGNWNDGWGLATFKDSDEINFYINDWEDHSVKADLPSGWSHVVGTYDGSSIRIYINGQLKDSKSYSSDIDHSNVALSIGKNNGDSYSWKGKIDEVKLFSNALPSSDIQEIYQNESNGLNWDGTSRDQTVCEVPFSCSEESYLTTFNNLKSALFSLNLGTGKSTEINANYTSDSINAIGYNVKDDLIWGWNISAKKVMQLDSQHKVRLYSTTVPTNMFTDEAPGFTSGDVSVDGFLYLAKPVLDHKLHKFDLNSGRPVYKGEIALSDTSVHFEDFAFNPVDNNIYSTYNQYLYRIDPSDGKVTNLGEFTGPSDYYFHSYVFDKFGNMYFYSDSNGGKIYILDLSDPSNPNLKATVFGTLDNATRNGDGARCANALLTPVRDFGDAPDAYSHVSHIATDTLYLGDAKPDMENYQQSSADAQGDNNNGTNDEDGIVTMEPLYKQNNVYTLPVKVYNNTGKTAYVTAWIDFDNDGVFNYNEAINSDNISVSSSPTAQTVTIQWDNSYSPMLSNITVDQVVMRLRVSTSRVLRRDDSYYHFGDNYQDDYFISPDGEVEDYILEINDNPGNTFECDNMGHVFNSPDYNDPFTDDYLLNLEDKTLNFARRFATRHINAAGYNVNDNYIYGIGDRNEQNGRYDLVKIDKDYNVESFTIDGLPQGETGYAYGDISFDNKLYVATVWDEMKNTHYLEELMVIDLINKKLEAPIQLNYPPGSMMIYSADFAFNPKDGMLYTVNSLNNQLVRINPETGWVTELGHIGNIQGTYSVISFFDIDGQYFFTNKAGDTIYKINISDPDNINPIAEVYAPNVNVPGSGDGAKCAYSRVDSGQPVAEYRFDACRWIGAKDEVRDSSVNALHGRAKGDAKTVADGMIGRAAYFDGDEDYLEIANDEHLQLTEDASFSFWINPEDLSEGRQGIIFKHYNNEYEIILESSGLVNFYHGDGSWENISKPNNIKVKEGEWSHVLLTRNHSKKKLTWYINGVQIGTANYSENPTVSNRNLTIGIRDVHHDYGFKGKLDELKLFDYTMVEHQVVNIYTNELIGKNWDGTVRLPQDCSPYQVNVPDIEQLEGNGSVITPFVVNITLDKPAPAGGLTLAYETVDGTAHNEDYLPENEDKVEVCHDGKTLSISVNALEAHLAHGDTEGPCPEDEDTSDMDGYDSNNEDHRNYKRYWNSWLIFIISYWKYEKYFSDEYSSYEDYYVNHLGRTPKDTGNQKSSGSISKTSHIASKGSMGAHKSTHGSAEKTSGSGETTTNTNDYFKTQGTLTIPEGEMEANVTLDVVGDNIVEPDETFSLNLLVDDLDADIVNFVNPSPGIIIIDDDDENGSHLEPIGCQPSAWIINDTKDLYEQNLSSRNNIQHADALIEYANAIGYNPADGFIWGYVNTDTTEKMLIKIGKESDGSYASAILGAIEGVNGNPDLPTGTGTDKAYINVGDIDSKGRLHLLYRKDADQGLSKETDLLYVIDLNSSSDTYKKVIDYKSINDGGKGLAIVDWAFHPLNDKLYAVSHTNAGNAKLYEIDPKNNYSVSTQNISGLYADEDGYYEAFFDDEGYFYAYSPKLGRIYYLDLSDPDNPAHVAHMFSFVPTGNGGDTARCNKAPMPNRDPELVAEYRFDDCESWLETGGTVKDNSGNELHGTTFNGVESTEGVINSGAYFDGTSYVQVPNDPKLQLTEDMAISFWFKADDENYAKTQGDQTVIVKGWTSEFEVYLKYNYNNSGLLSTNYSYHQDTDSDKQHSIEALNWNQWYHFTLVRNSSDQYVHFYINGIRQDTDPYSLSIPSSNDAMRIGAGYAGTGFKGTVDEVKIFEGMINSIEVNDIYTNELNGKNWDGNSREEIICEDPMEPFTCDGTLYLSNRSQLGTGNTDSGKTWLHSINRSNVPYDFDSIGEGYVSSNGGYNALGYNVQDNFMYALYGNTLVQIDKNAVVKELGVVAGLPSEQLYAGEFDRSGFYYASGMGGDDNRLYKIDIENLTVVETITLKNESGQPSAVRFWDMAIDASGSYFYTMLVGDGDGDSDYNNDKLAKINLSTGEITTIGESHSAMSSYISLVFGDQDGDIFMMSNEDGFYKVDLSTGQLYPMSPTQDLTFYNDGTSCPDGNITEPPSISINNVTGSEDIAGGEFVFTITISGTITELGSFDVEVRNGTEAIAPIEAAVSPDDYLNVDQTITLTPGEIGPIEIRVPIVDDTIMERHEQFYVNIVSPINIIVTDARGVGTIINDDMIKLSIERIDSDSYGEASNEREQRIKSNFYTQLTHKDFDYSIVSYEGASSFKEFEMKEDTPIRVDLYDMNSSTEKDKLMSTYYAVLPKGESRIKIDSGSDLNVEKATRYANFTLNVLLDQNGSIVTDTLFSTEAEYNATKADHNATEMYGYSDSFAIRPWGYRMQVTDSSKYDNKIYAINTDKDTSTPLAAEYPYSVDVQAIKHESDTVATNYRTYSVKELNATLEFMGSNSCADRNDSDLIEEGIFMPLFNAGESEGSTIHHHNSGEYRFVLEDINWTYVDQHDDQELAGCQMESSDNTLNDNRYGCKFSSSVSSDNDYNAMNLTFEPYDFNITNTHIVNRPNNNQNYIYMGDLNRSTDMGLELSADIIAEGKMGTRLSNFTDSCMAEDVTLDLNYLITMDRNISDAPSYNGLFTQKGTQLDFKRVIAYNYDDYSDGINEFDDINLSTPVALPKRTFLDLNRGLSHVRILYNIDKHLNEPMNPVRVEFSDLNASSPNAYSYAEGLGVTVSNTPIVVSVVTPGGDGTPNKFIPDAKVDTGSFDVNNTKTFYYAKVAPYEENYGDVVGSSLSTPVYIALYCGNMPKVWCTDLVSNNGLTGSFSQEGWHIAHLHDSSTDGNILDLNGSDTYTGAIPQIGLLPNFNANRPGRIESITTFTTSNTLPKTGKITMDLDPWLLYHPIKTNGQPFWQVRFQDGEIGTITGVGETGNMMETDVSERSSKRVDW